MATEVQGESNFSSPAFVECSQIQGQRRRLMSHNLEEENWPEEKWTPHEVQQISMGFLNSSRQSTKRRHVFRFILTCVMLEVVVRTSRWWRKLLFVVDLKGYHVVSHCAKHSCRAVASRMISKCALVTAFQPQKCWVLLIELNDLIFTQNGLFKNLNEHRFVETAFRSQLQSASSILQLGSHPEGCVQFFALSKLSTFLARKLFQKVLKTKMYIYLANEERSRT